MMLDLQTIVEELSKCDGKAWVSVTSQQQIHDLIKDDTVNDFHKIKNRFYTRINLSSSNVDEIIKWRILNKNSKGENVLKSNLNRKEYDFQKWVMIILMFDILYLYG